MYFFRLIRKNSQRFFITPQTILQKNGTKYETMSIFVAKSLTLQPSDASIEAA